MKILSVAIALSFAASAYAGELSQSLAAADEAEFLSAASGAWVKTGPAQYQTQGPGGEHIALSFGREAMIGDLADLEELADLQLIRLAQTTEDRELARLRHSLSQTRSAMESIQQGLDSQPKAHTYGSGGLQGCANAVSLQADFASDPMAGNVGTTTIEAWGPSSANGGGDTPVGTLVLTAIADGYVDTSSAMIVPTVAGQYLSASTATLSGKGGCKLQARAAIVPACAVSGYRSVSWSTDCKQVQVGLLPEPVYQSGKELQLRPSR
jgi:hypothetical protein